MEDCVDCEPEGLCQWVACSNDADYTIRDVTINKSGAHVFVGDVDLCAGHMRQFKRLGRLNLDWDLVWKAIEAET